MVCAKVQKSACVVITAIIRELGGVGIAHDCERSELLLRWPTAMPFLVSLRMFP
jgi:hypothetical protein